MKMYRFCLCFVFALVAIPVVAQDEYEDQVQPTCLSFAGTLYTGVKGTPYWVKNNEFRAPVGENGDMFVFSAQPQTDDEGEITGPTRIAIYGYTEENGKYKLIPVRTDIDVEKRYNTSRPGGGLMGSIQIDEASVVSIFIPHSVYALDPGEYAIRYKVVAFYIEKGKTLTEEYWAGDSIPVEVEKVAAKRGGKSGVIILNQIAFSPTDDGLPHSLYYKLAPVEK